VRDAVDRLKLIREQNTLIPLFLYGFSLGGLISAYIASDNAYLVDYLILESPALNLAEENRKLVEKYYSFCRFAEITGIMKVPFIGGAKFDATPGERPSYSRNKKSRIEYDKCAQDNGGMTMRMALSMLRAQTKIIQKIKLLKCPIFMAIGEDDKTIDPGANRKLGVACKADIFLYKDSYHCIHEELPEVVTVFLNDLKEWIVKQLIIRPVTGVSLLS